MRAFFFDDSLNQAWDDFCAASYCATFLHTRRFISYHGTRFHDCSVILADKEKWLGILPAARDPVRRQVVVSHPGLTYGGVIHRGALRGEAMLEALQAIARLLHAAGYRTLEYKAVPHIYQRVPAQDDLYALQRLGARRFRCDLSSSIDLRERLPVSERRRRGLRKASAQEISITSGMQLLEPLWRVLVENLERRHGARPTHSAAEIRTLAERFPRQISFHAASQGDELLAGVVMFDTGIVSHAQYIASSERGRQLCALDAVFESCIATAQSEGLRFFDFGISTEDQGKVLNSSLYKFKSEFGGGGIAYEFFELDLAECE